MKPGFLQQVLIIQGVYYFVAGLWPLVDIASFMEVTGPKTDIWLVKTVGALLIPISVSFITAAVTKSGFWPVSILGFGVSVALFLVDFYYSDGGIISRVYLAEGFIEIAFFITWLYLIRKIRRVTETYTS